MGEDAELVLVLFDEVIDIKLLEKTDLVRQTRALWPSLTETMSV